MVTKFYVTSSSRYTDVSALLLSYAVEVRKRGQVMLRAPLMLLEYGPPAPQHLAVDGSNLFTPIDWSFGLSLVRGSEKARWPFFVEAPLDLTLWVDEQWWEFRFSPGKTYTERNAERVESIKNLSARGVQ